MENIRLRSNPLPLKPVIFDDIIGITRTADALMESSPKPSDNKHVVCKGNININCSTKLECYDNLVDKSINPIYSTFALASTSDIFIIIPCVNDFISLFCSSLDGNINLQGKKNVNSQFKDYLFSRKLCRLM